MPPKSHERAMQICHSGTVCCVTRFESTHFYQGISNLSDYLSAYAINKSTFVSGIQERMPQKPSEIRQPMAQLTSFKVTLTDLWMRSSEVTFNSLTSDWEIWNKERSGNHTFDNSPDQRLLRLSRAIPLELQQLAVLSLVALCCL